MWWTEIKKVFWSQFLWDVCCDFRSCCTEYKIDFKKSQKIYIFSSVSTKKVLWTAFISLSHHSQKFSWKREQNPAKLNGFVFFDQLVYPTILCYLKSYISQNFKLISLLILLCLINFFEIISNPGIPDFSVCFHSAGDLTVGDFRNVIWRYLRLKSLR